MAVNLATITTLNRVRLYEGQPGTAVATVYTVPAATDVAVKTFLLCNTTTTAATVTIYVVPTGGTAGATNTVVAALTVAANQTVTIQADIYMTTGDFLAALQGTAAAITVSISGETYA